MTSADLIEMKQKIAEYERLEDVCRLCDRFAENLKNRLAVGSRIYFGINTQESTFHLHLTKAQRDKLSDLILEFKDDARKRNGQFIRKEVIFMTIETLKANLEAMRPDYVSETESVAGDELMYAQGQLAMLDQVLDMLEA